jgi:hypothetical protein
MFLRDWHNFIRTLESDIRFQFGFEFSRGY